MVEAWASWEGGLGLTSSLRAGHDTPDLIVHVARVLHCPRGSAAAAYVRWPGDGRSLASFEAVLSPDLDVARWNQEELYGGPGVSAQSAVVELLEVGESIVARVEFAWHELEVRFDGYGPFEVFDRGFEVTPARMTGVEARAGRVTAKLDGRPYPLGRVLQATWMPAGVIARG